MAPRRLPVLTIAFVGCLLFRSPIWAHCSDCFAPYIGTSLEEEQSGTGESKIPNRTRGQAGDVTAVSVSSLVEEIPSVVPSVLRVALVATGSDRAPAATDLSRAFSDEGVSPDQADSLARVVTGLLSTPLTVTRLANATTVYDRAVKTINTAASDVEREAFEAFGHILRALHAALHAPRSKSSLADSSVDLRTGQFSRSELHPKGPRGHPSSTISTPTAFGPGWGQVFAGVSYQNRIRYSDWQDGILVFGSGLGNPSRTVGLSLVIRLLDTYTEFAKDRSLSVTLHRRGPYRTAVAVGYENLWHTDGTDGVESRYAVLSSVLPLRTDLKAPLGSVVLSGGVGTDRFLSESRFARGEDGVSLFGSVGLRLLRPVNGIVNWSGQDLNLGISIASDRRLPFVITPALLDVTGSAGDGARWAVSASVGYNSRR